MKEDFRFIIPRTPTTNSEIFAIHVVTKQFYQEVQYRQEFQNYCEWYYSVGEKHRQEAEKMRNDLNIMGWFTRIFNHE
jgi:hypothetical protein